MGLMVLKGLMMSMKLDDIAILKIKNADYHCIISGINKIEAIKLLQNIDFTKKSVKQYINLLKINIKRNF